MSRYTGTILTLAAVGLLSGCAPERKAEAPATATAPASSETAMTAALSPASEDPPAVGTRASGTAALRYDPASMTLTWKIDYTGLSSEFAAAHFHGAAPPGSNAGVILPIAGRDGGKVPAGTLEGSAKLTEEQARTLLAGMSYINIHTARNPSGELRGQVVPAQ